MVYLFTRKHIGAYAAKPFRLFGVDSVANSLEEVENQVLSIAGALVLILLYFVYLYIRFRYFPHDFTG